MKGFLPIHNQDIVLGALVIPYSKRAAIDLGYFVVNNIDFDKKEVILLSEENPCKAWFMSFSYLKKNFLLASLTKSETWKVSQRQDFGRFMYRIFDSSSVLNKDDVIYSSSSTKKDEFIIAILRFQKAWRETYDSYNTPT